MIPLLCFGLGFAALWLLIELFIQLKIVELLREFIKEQDEEK